MGIFMKNACVTGFFNLPGLGDAVRIIIMWFFLGVIGILLLAGLVYMIVKKYPIKKIIGVGGIIIALILGAFLPLDTNLCHALTAIGIRYPAQMMVVFSKIFIVAGFGFAVWLQGIKNKVFRWLIWGWIAITGLLNTSWAIFACYIAQTCPRDYEYFDEVISRYSPTILGMSLGEFEYKFTIELSAILLCILFAILIAVPVCKLIRSICSKDN